MSCFYPLQWKVGSDSLGVELSLFECSSLKCNFQWRLAGSAADKIQPTQRLGYLILGASDKVLPIFGDHRQDLSSWLEHVPFRS